MTDRVDSLDSLPFYKYHFTANGHTDLDDYVDLTDAEITPETDD